MANIVTRINNWGNNHTTFMTICTLFLFPILFVSIIYSNNFPKIDKYVMLPLITASYILYLFSISGKIKKSPVPVSSDNLSGVTLIGLERLTNVTKQYYEDKIFLNDVKDTAITMYFDYLKLPDLVIHGINYGKVGMVIPKPTRYTYTIFDEHTAKYKNVDFNDLVKKEYKKLVDAFLQK